MPARTFVFCLLLILTACGGLGGEPEIVRTLEPPTPLPDDIAPPTAPPDLALGQQIYLANCTACHGVNGEGNGEQVLSGEVPDPGNFRLVDANAGQTPLQWYTTVTNGNLANLMPPWRDALNEEERWAVTMYTYTLSYTQEQVATGDAILVENAGLSELLNPIVTDLTEMATLTDGALRTFIRNEAPALSDAEVRAVQMAARLSTTQNSDTIFVDNTTLVPEATQTVDSAEVTPEPVTADRSGTVSGTVTNGTEGAQVPAGTTVTVTVFNQEFNISRFTTETQADGSYAISDVPFASDLFYVAEVNYRDRQFFNSYQEEVTEDVSQINIPITIYELTEDPDVITIVGDVIQIRPVASTLEILHIIRFRNDSDRAFTSQSELGDGRFASLLVSLPVGSIILGFDSQQRYSIIEEDFSFVDTSLVLPGSDHFTTVTYLVPYENDAIIEYPVNYRMEGASRVLINAEGMTLTGENYESLGEEQIGENTYQVYGAELSLEPSDVVRYEVSGGGTGVGTSADSTVVTSDNLAPLIGVAVVGVIIAGVVIYFITRRRSDAPATQNKDQIIDGLVRQIAELDAEHDAGQINHDLYHARRKQLKARLAELMDEE